MPTIEEGHDYTNILWDKERERKKKGGNTLWLTIKSWVFTIFNSATFLSLSFFFFFFSCHFSGAMAEQEDLTYSLKDQIRADPFAATEDEVDDSTDAGKIVKAQPPTTLWELWGYYLYYNGVSGKVFREKTYACGWLYCLYVTYRTTGLRWTHTWQTSSNR